MGKQHMVDKRHVPRFFRERLPSKHNVPIASSKSFKMIGAVRVRVCELQGQALPLPRLFGVGVSGFPTCSEISPFHSGSVPLRRY